MKMVSVLLSLGVLLSSEVWAKEFLLEYRDYRRSDRGVLLIVDSRTGGGPYLDGVLDFGAIAYLAKDAYWSYKYVKWLRGDELEEPETVESKWEYLLDRANVIDYFSLVHYREHLTGSAPLDELPLKRYQLRLAYSAACSSGGNASYIRSHNALAGVGHVATSASPLFSFKLFKYWTDGEDLEDAMIQSWNFGKSLVRGAEFFSFSEWWEEYFGEFLWDDEQDLLDESELKVSYTAEARPSRIRIDRRLTPRRVSREHSRIREKLVTELIEDR